MGSAGQLWWLVRYADNNREGPPFVVCVNCERIAQRRRGFLSVLHFIAVFYNSDDTHTHNAVRLERVIKKQLGDSLKRRRKKWQQLFNQGINSNWENERAAQTFYCNNNKLFFYK